MSKSNIDTQYESLESKIKFDKTNPKSRSSLRKLLINHMKRVYEKYGKQRPSGVSAVEFLNKLNNMSVNESCKVFREYQQRKKRDRDSELSQSNSQLSTDNRKKNQSHLMTRPKSMSVKPPSSQQNDQRLMDYTDGVGGSFAPFSSNHTQAGYITADGRVSRDRMELSDDNSKYMNSGGNKEQLEREMMIRQSEYEGHKFGYNNKRPEEPNFRRDGTDSRNDKIFNGGNSVGNSNEMFPSLNDYGVGDGMAFDGFNSGFNNGGNNNMKTIQQNMMQQMMSNPMMMAMMMQSMGLNPNIQNNQPIIDNNLYQTDDFDPDNLNLNERMKYMESSRNSMDREVQKQPNKQLRFDPMESPTMSPKLNPKNANNIDDMLLLQKYNDMMSGNWLNFNQGREHDLNLTREGSDYSSNVQQIIEEGQLMKKKIDDLKQEVMLNYEQISSFNPVLYPSLTVKQLNKLIKRINERLVIPGINDTDESESDKPENDNQISQDTPNPREQQLLEDKKKLTKALLTLRSKLDELQEVKQKSEQKSEKNIVSNHKIQLDEETNDDSDHEETIETIMTTNESVPFIASPPINKINKIDEESDDSFEVYDVVIDSKKEDPEFYGEYVVNLDQTYHNVIGIQLDSYEIPKSKYNIHPMNNRFYFKINDQEECVAIAKGNYNIESLINGLSFGFKYGGFPIEISLDQQNHVTITNTEQKKFDILCKPDSINRVLGFLRRRYINKNTYRSDNHYNLDENQKLYLFLDSNNSADYPFAEIDLTNNKSTLTPIKKLFDQPISDLSDLFVRFRYSNSDNSDENLCDFDEPNSLKLKILTKN
jgi:hypothetical protein